MSRFSFAEGFYELPLLKQVIVLAVFAGSIALAGYVAMWAKTPNYVPIFNNLTPKDSGDVSEALSRNNIKYRVDAASGLVLVDASKLYEARIKLASSGVPQSSASGFEILDKDSGFGTSQFIEQTRYLRGLQGELERTISSIEQIKSARIHLAIPKSSSFARSKKRPSASVFVDAYGGYEIEADQVSAITHLVASSIQGLTPDRVTVIDQNGKLLSVQGNDKLSIASRNLNYTHRVEKRFSDRIQEILTPLLGPGRVKAEVTAFLDFTSLEETSENYNPDNQVVRSERSMTSTKTDSADGGGVPGSISNRPENEDEVVKPTGSSNSQNQFTKNYEIDRKISHHVSYPGKLQKLSVAVVIDDKVSYDDAGTITKTPLSDDEKKRVESLVKDAIGYDETRGDAVTVINHSFATAPPPEELPPQEIYMKPEVQAWIKQGAGALLVLIIVFVLIRPMIKSLTNIAVIKEKYARELEVKELESQLGSNPMLASATGGDSEMSPIDKVREMITKDPKVAAQVIKKWVGDKDE